MQELAHMKEIAKEKEDFGKRGRQRGKVVGGT